MDKPVTRRGRRKGPEAGVRFERMPAGASHPVDIHVGARVRLRRTNLGISQATLGARVGLTFQQIQKYERGADRISANCLFEFARALDVPVSFFFDFMPEGAGAASGRPTAAIDVLARDETRDLAEAYYRIGDPHARKRFFELVKAVAGEGEDV